jgi:hypothetical protein
MNLSHVFFKLVEQAPATVVDVKSHLKHFIYLL